MRITTRALVAAAIAGSFAVLAAGCGGGGAGSNGGGPIDQVITINWGTEPRRSTRAWPRIRRRPMCS